MRRLAQPEVLKSSALAALATALACLPRLAQWPQRLLPLWYMEAIIFLGGMVLWGFVFGWHTSYSGRPVFTLKIRAAPFAVATLGGAMVAILLGRFLDPALRLATPQDFPAGLGQWLAMTLFGLGFTQLFLVFAPFAWALRVFQNRVAAVVFTVLFGVFVLGMQKTSGTLSTALLSALVAIRLFEGLLSLWLYLRGGVLLVWWLGLLLRARLLFELTGGS